MRRLAYPAFVPLLLAVACFDPDPPANTDGTETGTDSTATDPGPDDTAGACDNGVQDGDETDVDCGGSCNACNDGQSCGTDDDCASMFCNAGTCAAAACDDATRNGDETDVDCGGSCPPCADGSSCADGSDCESGVCSGDACTAPACGDGVVNDDAEVCDDGDESATCNADCTTATCGDGIVNMTAGETCDEMVETAACDADCTVAECGDGTFNAVAGEECDEGGNAASCDADCTAVACGDGVANDVAGEACDDAGESATCNADCTPAMCGDGVVNGTAGEQCDDGDMNDNNACNNACQFNGCSFNTALLPIMVHPSNYYGEMDFDGSCNLIVSGAFNGTLLRVTPAGVVSTLVPSFGGAGSINGVAYRASDDRIYVSTDSPAQLWSVTPMGVPSLVMALPATANAIEVAPAGFGAFGNRIVGAMTNGQVLAIDPTTATTQVVGSFGTILSDLVFDPSGTAVFVAAYNEGQVAAMGPGGGTMLVTNSDGPDGLAFAPGGGGRLLIANTNGAPAVTLFNLTTGMSNVIANPLLDGGYYVTGLLFEASGHVLIKSEGANITFATVP